MQKSHENRFVHVSVRAIDGCYLGKCEGPGGRSKVKLKNERELLEWLERCAAEITQEIRRPKLLVAAKMSHRVR